MNVLVTGGAGYIGSHAVKALLKAGHDPVVLDNLGRGHRAATPDDVPFEELDLLQTDAIANALTHHRIECVMHFAALAFVGESVSEPLKYYWNNTAGTVSLLEGMRRAGVHRMVFSSTCATYGQPEKTPITEDTPQHPVSPYGQSKLFVERILRDYGQANRSFGYAALRYFNVAGCDSQGELGEDHDPETHLIPVILPAALGKRDQVVIFGNDYPTPDGTCIRDYIHVEDLVDAHIRVMDHLKDGDARAYNLGIGKGYSVHEVIDAARKVTDEKIDVVVGDRREGDPPRLYANADKIKRELGWEAKIKNIEQIVETAWRWFKTHPDGYRKP